MASGVRGRRDVGGGSASGFFVDIRHVRGMFMNTLLSTSAIMTHSAL